MPKHNESANRAAQRTSRSAPPGADETGQAPGGPGFPAHVLTINIPLDEAIEMAEFPVRLTGRMLSSKGGIPLYAGLGILAAAQIIEWPVAAAAGVGYAVLRRWGPLRPPHPAARNSGNGKAAG